MNKNPSTHTHKVYNRLCKAYGVHGHSYSIGKGEYQTDGSTQLWTQATTDQEVGPTWKQDEEGALYTLCIRTLWNHTIVYCTVYKCLHIQSSVWINISFCRQVAACMTETETDLLWLCRW